MPSQDVTRESQELTQAYREGESRGLTPPEVDAERAQAQHDDPNQPDVPQEDLDRLKEQAEAARRDREAAQGEDVAREAEKGGTEA